jgi:hypothetical protein
MANPIRGSKLPVSLIFAGLYPELPEKAREK